MVLLGWPATRPSSTCRSRSDKAAAVAGDLGHRCASRLASCVATTQRAADGRQAATSSSNGFSMKVDRAEPHRLDRQRHVAVAGDDDHRHLDPALPQLPQQVDAAHLRHAHVGDDAARADPRAARAGSSTADS